MTRAKRRKLEAETKARRMIRRVPVAFSRDRLPGEPIITRSERMPPEAARMGRMLAGMARGGLRILRRQGITLPAPCKSCAFRLGTVPNRCIDTVADAMKCVMEGERMFLCHEPREGDLRIDRMCWGAARARAWAVEEIRP